MVITVLMTLKMPTFLSLKSAKFGYVIPICIGLLVLLIGCFLTVGVDTNDWGFILQLRGKKLVALMLVGFAIGSSTLLFQTLTNNPILTPSLLGFDALYVLINSALLFFLGIADFIGLSELAKFFIKISLMLAMSFLLFHFLFNKSRQDLTRLILVGVVCGVLFRSLSALIARMISPDNYVVVQSTSFAQFNTINTQLLGISMAMCATCAIWLWRIRYACDVLLLGKHFSINLGVNYRWLGLQILALVAILVSVSTALVGPITFLGLLVCALTNQLSNTMYHTERLPLVCLIAMLCLVGGEFIFERVFNMTGVLSIVIELLGGMVFLILVFRLHGSKNRALT